MPAQLFYSQSACLAQAAAARTRLAGASVRLWKAGLALAWDTPLSELNANQADFSGYPVGGIAISAWGTPVLAPGQAAAISGGVQTFAVDGGVGTNGNVIGGWYLVTSDNVLWVAGQFPESIPMQVPGAGQTVSITLLFPSG